MLLIRGLINLLKDIRFWILILTLLNIYPVVSIKHYTTGDGAPHTYNSMIIAELLLNPNGPYSVYFQLNDFPVSNWTGHFILTIFNLFLPGWLAEKILQLIYIISLPLAYRYFLLSFTRKLNPVWLLVFPLCYSFNFSCGFYNFCIAMVLMFFILGYCKRHAGTVNLKNGVILFFLFTLLYFSHLFVLGLTIAAAGLIVIVYHFNENKGIEWKSRLVPLPKKILMMGIAALPALLLSSKYFLSRGSPGYVYLTNEELLDWIVKLRPLITFGYHLEANYTVYVSAGLAVFFLLALFSRIIDSWRQRSFLKPYDVLFLLTSGMFLLYMILPESDGYAGYVTLRLCTLFFLFLAAWLSLVPVNRYLYAFPLIFILWPSCEIMMIRMKYQEGISRTAENIIAASKYIAPYSTLVSIDFSDHWMEYQYGTYSATEHPVILLRNYEADATFFPVLWNNDEIPDSKHAFPVSFLECTHWESRSERRKINVDYFLLYGDVQSDCRNTVLSILEERKYRLIFNRSNVQVYSLR